MAMKAIPSSMNSYHYSPLGLRISVLLSVAVALLAAAFLICVAPSAQAGAIVSVVETGGFGDPTAKFTGQTFTGPTIGTYTVPTIAPTAKCFTDRAHAWTNASGATAFPPYLQGREYIMMRNDDRGQGNLRLDVTVCTAVRVYLLIESALSDGDNNSLPTFGAGKMQWVLDEAWAPVMNGINRSANAAIPDEVGIDEGANGTIDRNSSIYTKTYPAGTFQLKQADNTGQNMYGVVIAFDGAPNTPQNLTAVSGDNRVTLNWAATCGADGYVVKRSLLSGGPYDNIATNAAASYVDTTVVNGLTYYYVVSAFNSTAGESANSIEATGEPKAAPTGVLAIGGTNQVEVRWDPFPGAATYTVKRATTSGGPYSTLASGVTDTNYLDTGLLTGKFYYYVVVAQLLLGGD